MLQVQNLPSSPEDQSTTPTEPGVMDAVERVLGILRRQLLVVSLFTLIGLIGGLVYLLITPRVFTAEVEILFERGGPPVVSQQPMPTEVLLDRGFFESQLKIIQSENIARVAVQKLDLARDPGFAKSGGAKGFLIKLFRGDAPKSPDELEEQATAALLERLEAKRDGASNFITIGFQSTNAKRAEDVVNAIADAYIADRKQAKLEAYRQANEWLRERLEELRRKAAADEQAVNAYKADKEIVTSGGVLVGDQVLSALNAELVSARAKASEAKARLDRIESTLRTDAPDVSVDAISDALSSPIITRLRQDYLSLASKAEEFSQRFGESHLAAVKAREKVRLVQDSIVREVRRLAQVSKSDYLTAKNRQQNIEAELESAVMESQATNRAQIRLRDLESAAQSARALFNLFQQRFLESTEQQSFSISDVRATKSTLAANNKKAPKILAMSIFVGLALGGGLGLLRELMNRAFRASGQVEKILRIPCVALVPVVGMERAREHPPCHRPSSSLPNGSRNITYRSPLVTTLLNSRFSRLTDAIRAIKVVADLNLGPAAARDLGVTIGISSSMPGEGKSTIALALGELIAQLGRRVIVLDCDLRNPSLSRMLAPDATNGLLEVASDSCDLQDGIWTDPQTKMDFLPVVVDSRTSDAYELLVHQSTDRLVQRLRQRYDYVVIDLPPILPVIDVRASAHLFDLCFLVVEWGRTKIEIVERVLRSSNSLSDRLAGVVLNKVDVDYLRRYEKYDFMSYYAKDDEPASIRGN